MELRRRAMCRRRQTPYTRASDGVGNPRNLVNLQQVTAIKKKEKRDGGATSAPARAKTSLPTEGDLRGKCAICSSRRSLSRYIRIFPGGHVPEDYE